MQIFRAFLIIIFLAIAGYTSVVISKYGMNLLPIFFGDMLKVEWAGQFNLDFMSMLSLSGLWVSWRHRFTALGIMLGILALFGGALFLSAYLFIESFRARGDVTMLLLGDNAKPS